MMKRKIDKKILVVDDSLDSQALLKVLLEANEYNVYCTSNGQEALSLLHELSELPDLILLDTQMPEMDGYQFRKEQFLDVRLRQIPVIVTTGDNSLEVSKKMNSPRMILCKPLNLDTLLKSISDCF